MSDKARQYACGLMQGGSRKNMDRMAEVVPDSKSRNLQQFITHSKWNARAVMDDVATDANTLLGHDKDAGLIIDETSFKKQGRSSVGVARQWLGRLGKVDNGQVAVFGVLANNRFVTPVDTRLYLPKQWTEDSRCCDKAGIPKEFRTFKTKDELALDMVAHLRGKSLSFGWVGADGGYGKGPKFCIALEMMGERFIIDLHSDFRVFLEDPKPYIPEKPHGRGRKPSTYKTDIESLKVADVIESADLKKQSAIHVRDSSRGSLTVRSVKIPVYVWDGSSDKVYHWILVATQTLGQHPETKISMSNFSAETSLKDLAYRQRQRYWVERAFQDAKGECGMADYQVRKWGAWHHHMALVMMSMLFMLNERINQENEYPLLSCADIEELLAKFLPRRDIDKKEVIRQMVQRHKMRQAAIESHSRKNQATISKIRISGD